MPDGEPIDYGEFGQSFIELVVTPDRIDEAMAAATAKPFPPDTTRVGPGDLVTATATGKVGTVTVTSMPSRLPDVWFTTRLEIGLELVLSVAGTDHEFQGSATVDLQMHVQTYRPLTIYLEIEPVTPEGVSLTLEAQSRWGEILRQMGKAAGQDIEEEVRERLASKLNETFKEDRVMEQRTFDVLKMVREADQRP